MVGDGSAVSVRRCTVRRRHRHLTRRCTCRLTSGDRFDHMHRQDSDGKYDDDTDGEHRRRSSPRTTCERIIHTAATILRCFCISIAAERAPPSPVSPAGDHRHHRLPSKTATLHTSAVRRDWRRNAQGTYQLLDVVVRPRECQRKGLAHARPATVAETQPCGRVGTQCHRPPVTQRVVRPGFGRIPWGSHRSGRTGPRHAGSMLTRPCLRRRTSRHDRRRSGRRK